MFDHVIFTILSHLYSIIYIPFATALIVQASVPLKNPKALARYPMRTLRRMFLINLSVVIPASFLAFLVKDDNQRFFILVFLGVHILFLLVEIYMYYIIKLHSRHRDDILDDLD